ncbi:hypothetical protein M409DRAFT_50389 [Zasmidium cellare ATCC 36951]|uniref:Uncharacterized protein n=1 Tax=Zasmidium cellare ATCC 36951 TaxID=1080233 RepID=A0A6A6CYD8_ZASCE|nr:uncharacterized protein M409DRAFT_50389 [Zasmidium cellare ATCC 36951]KAF2171733.1 hypothetical protein M409DRAFT_50389 [Zasmidium cellare ATCC 36951]
MVAIFKRKGKAAKEAEKKDSEKPAEEAPPKPTYKHVPTHAASDSVGQGSRLEDKQDRNHIAIASRRRAANSMYDSTLGNASFQQSIAHELAHGTPSPMTPYGSQPRYQDDMYYGEFDSPQMAGHPMTPGHMRMSRQSGDYFAQSMHRGRSYESRGKGKEHGYGTPYYSDSGYESAGPPSGLPSRDPSLQNLQDLERQYMSRDNKGLLLPEPRFSEDFANMSIDTDQLGVADAVVAAKESAPKNSGNVSPLDLDADSRSTKSTTSVSKRTRFEDDPEPMPELDQLEQHRNTSSPVVEQAPVSESKPVTVKPEEPTESPVDSARGSPVESDAESEQNEPSPVKAVDESTEVTASPAEVKQQADQTEPRPSTQTIAGTSRASVSNDRPNLQRMSSAPSTRRMTLPPLTILEGLKVNKKGLILDEEGDPIGQLIDGELLDCVRQKANGNGEVLDEYGRVVGTVRTIPAGADISPVVASRPNTSHHAGQARAQNGRPQLVYHTQSESAVPRQSQRKSTQARPEVMPEEAGSESVSRDFAEQPKRSAPRTASERSLAELSKPYARPTMTSVPENNVPEEDAVPDSPGLYAFKGELPADDKPQEDARMRSRSPPTQVHPANRPALAGGHPYSQMYAPMMSSQVYPGGRMGPRRATTQFAGYGSMHGGLSAPRFPQHRPAQSPLSSHESSPLRSDAGFDQMEGGRPPIAHSRANSMHSAAGNSNKPRTYFTHGGKVTVDPNAPKPEKAAEKAEEAHKEEEKQPEKKKRFSVGFGKKDKKEKEKK